MGKQERQNFNDKILVVVYFDQRTGALQKNNKNHVLLLHVLQDFEQLSFNFFVYLVLLVTEKVVLAPESLFRPANGVRSTRSLVEIHNI